MDTIKSYLDNMFARLPKTNEILKLKNDLLANMEDKYNELKRDGKSENEAIGIVISEFGNIDELLKELGVEVHNVEEVLPTLTEQEVNDYMKANKRNGKVVGFGVVLCILGAASLILISQLVVDGFISGLSEDAGNILGLVVLLILVAIAVGMFIYSGMRMEKFKYLEEGFELPTQLRVSIEKANEAFQPTYTLAIIIGVVLCILSAIPLFVTSTMSDDASVYGLVGVLFIVSMAVYIFIYFGTIKDSFKKLLKLEEYVKAKKEREKEDKVIGAVAAIIWPLAVIIFLISGLVYQQWHINWIVFPITGLLFAMFSGAYSIMKEK